jgi:hypothetical protein
LSKTTNKPTFEISKNTRTSSRSRISNGGAICVAFVPTQQRRGPKNFNDFRESRMMNRNFKKL